VATVTGTGVATMPRQKDFRVIRGGKPSGTSAAEPIPVEIALLLDRARSYRRLLAQTPNSHVEALVTDLEDAVGALRRLNRSGDAVTSPRAAEYRRLVAELDSEILLALRTSSL
jgi:hypothetical protein